jgi:hypothetical protein
MKFVKIVSVALALSGVGVLSLLGVGCGTSPSSVCAQSCNCTGCSTAAQQTCDETLSADQTNAGNKGCNSEFNAWLSCVSSNLVCDQAKESLPAGVCTTELTQCVNCAGADLCGLNLL